MIYLIPEELAVPLSIGLSIFFIICKFTFAPHLSWVFCLFPIWLPLLLTTVIVIVQIIWIILESLYYDWF